MPYMSTTSNYARKRQRAYKSTYPNKKANCEKKEADKHVAQIAKRVVLRAAESKDYFYHWQFSNNNNNTQYAVNLFFDIGQGTSDFTRVGDKIYVDTVNLKLNWLMNPALFNAPGLPQMQFRILVLTSNHRQNNGILGSPPTWSGPTIMKSGYFQNGMVDTEKFTVIRDQQIEFNPLNDNTSSANAFRNLKIPFKRNIQYDADGGGFLKGKQYYLVWLPYSTEAFVSLAVQSSVVQNIKFKDI